jgi:hypothetical protein
MYLGDYAAGDTIDFNFTTRQASGAPFTLAGTPAISVYKGSSATESTSGVTLTADYDSRTGLNHVTITTASDGTFYADGSQFECVITTGTVNSVSVVGEVVGRFTLRAQASLYPTTAGRKLDVSAGGEAGVDWANVGSPTTTLNLSGTTVSTSQAVASVSGAVGSVTGSVASVSGNVGGNVVGSVGSVTSGVTVSTNNDKTGYALTSAYDLAKTAAQASDIPTANQNADALLDRSNGVETGCTVRQSLRLANSANAGKDNGLSGTTVRIRDINDTKDRITATVDGDGNRSAITLDLT